MTETQAQASKAIQSLRESVKELMERRRRLGQYFVIWRDGRPVRVDNDGADPAKDAETEENIFK